MSPEKAKIRGRRSVAVLAAFTTLLVSAACSEASAADLEGVSPQQRYEYDYTAGTIGSSSIRNSENGGDCLDKTAYDTTYGGGAATGTVEADGTIVITPNGTTGNQGVLRLVIRGNDIPLQPADEAAGRILSFYGCKVDAY